MLQIIAIGEREQLKLLETSIETPRAVAQDHVYEAMEIDDPALQDELLAQALEIDPDCGDVYFMRAYRVRADPEKALPLLREAVERGERSLGEEYFKKHRGGFWLAPESRPYMRALSDLANNLEQTGRWQEACIHWNTLLELNTEDSQGIRITLLCCLLEHGTPEQIEALIEKKGHEKFALWPWARVLLEFRRSGDAPSTHHALKAAETANPYIAAYLTGDEEISEGVGLFYSPGDIDEAEIIADRLVQPWRAVPGAVAWLKKNMDRNSKLDLS